MVRLSVITALLVTASATSAYADWQYTKWGMTPAQVQAAAGGKLGTRNGSDACPSCKPVPMLAGEYATEEFRFRTLFQFAAGQTLSMIDLRMHDEGGQCRSLYNSLATRYGSPVFQGGGGALQTARWLDATGGNTVFFINSAGVDGQCTIQYSPLVSNKGL